jgi:two-component system, NtrC family, C4-dicarboxylate transport response regulator DctD
MLLEKDGSRQMPQPPGVNVPLMPSHEEHKGKGGLMGSKVLLIDDSEDIRVSSEYFLRKAGYDVTLASMGKDGLAKFKPGVFGVVVCDMKMPDMNGDQVVRAIKGQDPAQKVILYTTDAPILTPDDRSRIGADVYLEKDLPTVLVDAVQSLEKLRL